MKESEGTSATTVTRETMELTGGSDTFYGWKYSHNFVVVEDNDKNLQAIIQDAPYMFQVRQLSQLLITPHLT